MSALTALSGGGGVPSVSPSSSASSGPQAGATGNEVLNFGGINLGNEDIPTNASSVGGGASASAPATVGTVPSAVTAIESYLPLILIIGAVAALAFYLHKKL